MSGRVSLSFVRYYTNSITSNLNFLLKTMPKDKPHITAVQRQRRKIKEKFTKYSPGKVALQVLGSGANGAPNCLYVFSDQSRYLFNCGEGTQRLAHEHKMKLAKLEHIFVTQAVWKNMGGLPGAALTVQDVGVPEITLHGPEGLNEIFAATRRFIVIKDLEIRIAECNEKTSFEDNVLKVKYVPIVKASRAVEDLPSQNFSDAELQDDEIDYYAHEQSGKRRPPTKISADSMLALQGSKARSVSMAYICQVQPRPGALRLDKCVEFNVPPGPLLGRLKAGEDITLANGKIVKSTDVCEPDDPGPVFIVLECPSEDYLDSLLNNEIFKKHQSSATRDEDLAHTVVHFSPPEIIQHPRYQEWMDKFSASTHHIIINESNKCMGSSAVHRIQYKLNLLSPTIFPLLGDIKVDTEKEIVTIPPPLKKNKSENDTHDMANIPTESASELVAPKSFCVNTLFNYHLRPKKGCDSSLELKINSTEFIEETLSLEKFPAVLHEVTQQMSQMQQNLLIREYPKLLFLGTGSSIPNKTRNTSGILLQIDENTIIILDAGEGTYGQIVRFYGQEKSAKILSKIKAIYISHLHADHHLGLIGLMQGRQKALRYCNKPDDPILLIAPKQIMNWLRFYDGFFEHIYNCFQIIHNGDLIVNSHNLGEDIESKLLEVLNCQDISTCFVPHCPNSFGIAVTLVGGYKITYSGDTMPSENLIELGKDSNLLIHEATMEDDLAQEAVIKLHSTTSQAIDVGKKMNAKYTLLTHFSQRYAKLPRFNDNFSGNVGIAFDNMQVKLDELPLIPLLYPALKVMFVEHYEEMEQKAIKRQLKMEREAVKQS